MFGPTQMTKEQRKKNDRMLTLRLKHEDFILLDGETIDDFIIDCDTELFRSITKQFRTPGEYSRAITLMEKCIDHGKRVPWRIWRKIKKTRRDFRTYEEKDTP